MTARHVGIVGGGMLGMTLALRLRARGHRVTVLESAPAVGGLAASMTLGGVACDRFYHVVLPADTALLGVLDEIGAATALRWRATRTGFYTDGRLHSLSTTLDFLRFPPIGLVDKLRLGLTILWAARVHDWRRLEAIPVADWLRRLSGRRTFERIWLPLLRSKLGENYRVTSASFIWATIARLYGARRSGAKREYFGWLQGGYAAVLAHFAQHLTARGVTIACNARAVEVRDESARGGDAVVQLASGGSLRFDAVVLTLPTHRIADVAPQLTVDERKRLRGVTYQGIVCATLLLRRPLADYYVTNITDAWPPYTAVIETTALADPAAYGGHTLVYLPRYVPQDDPIWEESDESVRTRFLDALARMYPDLSAHDVLACEISRARDVLALTTLHYSDHLLPPVRTSLPRVFVVTSAQIAAGTLNVNETIRVADAGATTVAVHLARMSSGAPSGAPARSAA